MKTLDVEEDALVELAYLREVRNQMPNGGAILRLVGSHLSDGYRVLAQFQDNKQGKRLLKKAGFKMLESCKTYSDWK